MCQMHTSSPTAFTSLLTIAILVDPSFPLETTQSRALLLLCESLRRDKTSKIRKEDIPVQADGGDSGGDSFDGEEGFVGDSLCR